MTITAAEQYLLELMNRARLDPAGEAARFGINLNAGLSAGQIGTMSQQVLAPNTRLESAATGHSLWMLSADVFSHTGSGGSMPWDRATAKGYDWDLIGENLGLYSTSGALNLKVAIIEINKGLFLSPSHRVNLLNPDYREVGISAESGAFTQGGATNDALMVTEMFGRSGTAVFLTGVAYTDTDKDQFYSIGEGRGGVTFAAKGISTTTESAGGYAISMTGGPGVSVTGKVGTLSFSATVDMSYGNVKLDVVNGNTFYTSGHITLLTGIQNVLLLGVNALNVTGTDLANKLTGNKGSNMLDGRGGNDVIKAGSGNDKVQGGTGNDNISGDNGNDDLKGGAGLDTIVGGAGADKIYGEAGNDRLTGGTEADTFVFGKASGTDRITDFSVAQKDMLHFDDAIWGSTAMTETQLVSRYARDMGSEVVFDFGNGQVIHLTGVASTAGLAAQIDII